MVVDIAIVININTTIITIIMPPKELSAVAFCRAHAAGKMASRDKDRSVSLPRLRAASVDILRVVLSHLDITDPLNITTWTMLHATSCYWRALQLLRKVRPDQMPLRLDGMLTAGRFCKADDGNGGRRFCQGQHASLVVFRDAGWFLREMTYSVPDSATATCRLSTLTTLTAPACRFLCLWS